MKLLKVGLLIAGIASILFAAGCGGGQVVPTPVAAVKAVSPTTQPAAEPAMSGSIVQSTGTISAVKLVEEFNNNAVGATQKYSGLDLVVEGKVTAIDYDFFGNPYVSVGSGGLLEIQTVWCMVSDVSEVSGFSVGDKVTVEGTFSEWNMFVMLEPCAP